MRKTLLHPFYSLLGWPRLLSLGYKANDMWITCFCERVNYKENATCLA